MTKIRDYKSTLPLPNVLGEKHRFVAILRYQYPKRITLNARSKTSPRFETLYGLYYWLNKQDYHAEYRIYSTTKAELIKSGFKKKGEWVHE